MSEAMLSYYAGRERVERAAADRAACSRSRNVHLDLADRYARLARPRQKLSLVF